MKAQVVYHSKTGHSRKLAQKVAEALGTEAMDIRNWHGQDDSVLLFIVSGIYGGRSDRPLLDFAASLKGSGVKAAGMITSCAGGKDEPLDLRAALEKAGITILKERFVCPGSFLIFKRGRPNDADRAAAASYAVRMMNQFQDNKAS